MATCFGAFVHKWSVKSWLRVDTMTDLLFVKYEFPHGKVRLGLIDIQCLLRVPKITNTVKNDGLVSLKIGGA